MKITNELGSSTFAICRRIKELGEDLARHTGLTGAVRRRQLKPTTMHEEVQPDSGVRPRVRGRFNKSQAPISSTKGMSIRRGRRAA